MTLGEMDKVLAALDALTPWERKALDAGQKAASLAAKEVGSDWSPEAQHILFAAMLAVVKAAAGGRT